MLFDIISIREEIGGRIFRDELVNLPWETEATRIELLLPWRVQAEVVRNQTGFLLTGKASGQYRAICDRCLSSFEQSLTSEFSVCFVQSSHGRNEHEEFEADDECARFDKDVIDATPVIVESIVLQMPMKQLCSPNCNGLCAQCGVNLNQQSCECLKEANDPRWSRLELLSGTKGGGHNGQPKE